MTKRIERPFFAKPALRAVIDEQGRKISWVASIAKMSASHTSRVLSQERPVPRETALDISRNLGIPINLVFTTEVVGLAN